jgi:hypothetical protein
LGINTVHARVHTVPDGLLLVSPGIFKDFDRENWSLAQKRFQKLKLHQRTPQGTNIWVYLVKGERAYSAFPPQAVAELADPADSHRCRLESAAAPAASGR